MERTIEPAKRATALDLPRLSPAFAGSNKFLCDDPGACAPGFMLSLASRALVTPASPAKTRVELLLEGVPTRLLETVCVCVIFVVYIPFRKLRGVTPAKRRKDVVK